MATEIHPTALVAPKAQIGQDVKIGPFCIVKDDAVVGDGCILDAHVVVHGHTTLGPECMVSPYASLGGPPQDITYKGEPTVAEIGAGCHIREYVTINRGTVKGGGVTRVGDKCLLMASSHVAHDCEMGREVIIANSGALAGHVTVGNYATIGGLSAVHQFVRIGDYAYIGGMSAVSQDVPPYVIATSRGESFLHGLNKIGLKRRGFSDDAMTALKKAYRLFFRYGLTVPEAAERVKAEVEQLPEVVHLIEFMQSSKRGISR